MGKKAFFILITCIISVFFTYALGNDFPMGSVMNFNPAYMVSNTKWALSYESYFEGQKMNIMVFQPFENGFAGKIGFYTDSKGNGIAYSIASKRGNLALGSDLTLSNSASSLSFDVGFGMIQNVLKNLIFDLRVPHAFTYVYKEGIQVHPNAKMALNFVKRNWNAALFAGIDYPWVSGGAWGSFSAFGAQAYLYFESGYDSSISTVEEQKLDFILQYTLSNVKLAYIYDSYSNTLMGKKSLKSHGIRISVEW